MPETNEMEMEHSTMVKCIHSLETDIPDNMNPTLETLLVLKELEKNGLFFFRFDPNDPMALTSLDQLREIAGNVGYTIEHLDDKRCWIITDSEQKVNCL
jgi:hypothetical protein